ncbi:hypothetical protein HMN09_00921200 [Mycena chlorophos]|uniref:Uncharacterized protein n=1 Tax=Mycena chlorophos TaxID=658473 RepID=A0A8H6SJ94_MYCCL|nr:hypothetical protein HMN09_00921200 [Mycena chlorophos]
MTLINSGLAASLTLGIRKQYRSWAFPSQLADSTHVPFFSTQNPEQWITEDGYNLFHHRSSTALPDLDIDDIPGDELAVFQRAIVPPLWITHPFFSFDNAAEWIRLLPLGAFMASRAPQLSNLLCRAIPSCNAGSVYLQFPAIFCCVESPLGIPGFSEARVASEFSPNLTALAC